MAMGTACVPSYANLDLGLWEREIFLTQPITGIENVHLWIRYIDNALFIWQGSEESLIEFVQQLNVNIRLTLNYDRNKIEFLDTMIIRDHLGN